MRYSHFSQFIKPISISAIIISPFLFSKICSRQYIQLSDRCSYIHKSRIRSMNFSIHSTFFGSNYNHPIRSTGSINGRSCPIFQDINRSNIIFIQIIKTTAWYTVNYNQRTQSGWTRGYSTYLNTGWRIRIRRSRILYCKTWNLSLNLHGRITTPNLQHILTWYVGNCTSQFLLWNGTITYYYHFIQQLHIFFHHNTK